MRNPDWWRWMRGTRPFPAARTASVKEYLRSELGSEPQTPPCLSIPSPSHSTVDLSQLDEVGEIDISGESRLYHSVGRSYGDLLRLRRGHVTPLTDAVIYPSSNGEVLRLLQRASAENIAVVAWGGGTSVVGGVAPLPGECRAVVTLSLERMNRLLRLDKASLLGTFQCGITGPVLEEHLGKQGLTLGHFPQSFEMSTLGGWMATRSSGQASSLYGNIDARVRGARLITPQGEIFWETPVDQSVGPRLHDLLLGNEGTLGVFTEATLELSRVPEVQLYHGGLFSDWEEGVLALKELAQGSPIPAVLRLSDPAETALTMAGREPGSSWSRLAEKGYLGLKGRSLKGSCLSIVGFDIGATQVRVAREAYAQVLKKHGGLDAGTGAGRAWKRERFLVPSLRDDLMDFGWMVETLETGANWTLLPKLRTGVLRALKGRASEGGFPLFVGAHLSHAVASGACLYVTLIAPQPPGEEEEPLQGLKVAATEAILSLGGSLSHHHGVGQLHQPWISPLSGPLETRLLSSAKNLLDPSRVLNPGKTLPRGGS